MSDWLDILWKLRGSRRTIPSHPDGWAFDALLAVAHAYSRGELTDREAKCRALLVDFHRRIQAAA